MSPDSAVLALQIVRQLHGMDHAHGRALTFRERQQVCLAHRADVHVSIFRPNEDHLLVNAVARLAPAQELPVADGAWEWRAGMPHYIFGLFLCDAMLPYVFTVRAVPEKDKHGNELVYIKIWPDSSLAFPQSPASAIRRSHSV